MTEDGLTTAIKLLNEANEKARLALENIKTIQKWTIKEQKQGEWIMHSDKVGLSVECPFCHKEMAGDDLNYCCKCGAKLGGDT